MEKWQPMMRKREAWIEPEHGHSMASGTTELPELSHGERDGEEYLTVPFAPADSFLKIHSRLSKVRDVKVNKISQEHAPA